MSKTILPFDHQVPLPMDKLIIEKKPEGDDVVPLDVVFVGAGPAGLAGAIELAKLVKADPSVGPIEIGVLEKAASLGGHSLSGAVINPCAFKELFPDLKISDFPFRKAVTEEKVYLLTESGQIRIPTPPTMQNHGYHTASLSEVVRWMGKKAEEAGVNILTSFSVESLMMQGNQTVGVRTTAAGLKRDGQPGPNALPPTEISARVVALSEGTRGPLAQAYMQKMKITSKAPQIFALGVKEVWKVKKAPKEIIHTLGFPLPKDAFGGSFLYPLADDMVSFGLVAGLDYKSSHLDVHTSVQRMKQHPLFKSILEGGECLEWGAKTIPEGGFHALPERFSGDGLVMMGDTVGLVNVPALKGIHYAMTSGMLAARAIFKALKENNVSGEKLQAYDHALHESFVWRDLKEVRNMRHSFKSGFYLGGLKATLMTITKGAFPGDGHMGEEDAKEPKVVTAHTDSAPIGMSKVDAVFHSGNKTRDDIPQHLIVGKDISGDVADFYSHVCPAGVYERRGDTLVVNAPNCVDCKATDVLGPRWTPREGGSGPDYKLM
jgi:electron-transferring-flavoprotein dehydrogenase